MTSSRIVIPSLFAAFALTASVTSVQAAGCCSGGDMQMAAADHQHGTEARQTATKELMPPIPAVLDNYARIQAALAADKLDGVPAAAQEISKLVTGDQMKMLPAVVATQADALAKAKDLASAREAFKSLSASLIGYLDKAKAQTGKYYELYCPMAKASWLQTDKAVKNPYFGAAMSKCGEVKRAI